MAKKNPLKSQISLFAPFPGKKKIRQEKNNNNK
jgi:hypothetical protein